MNVDQTVLNHDKISNLLLNYHMSMFQTSLSNFDDHKENDFEMKNFIVFLLLIQLN